MKIASMHRCISTLMSMHFLEQCDFRLPVRCSHADRCIFVRCHFATLRCSRWTEASYPAVVRGKEW